MKISIDLDGTLYSHMTFFKLLWLALKQHGHEVGILTGHSLESQATDRKIITDLGFPEPDFYLGRTPEHIPFNGAIFKIEMIKQHNIDMHYDDYDYDHPITTRLFEESDIRTKIAKLKFKEPRGTKQE